jgi:XTP/dITP diphosphohydrolase
MKLVVASNNPGKLREFGALLTPLGWEILPQLAHGVSECRE